MVKRDGLDSNTLPDCGRLSEIWLDGDQVTPIPIWPSASTQRPDFNPSVIVHLLLHHRSNLKRVALLNLIFKQVRKDCLIVLVVQNLQGLECRTRGPHMR